MQALTKTHEDYFYRFSELSGSQRQLRLEGLTGRLNAAVRSAGGRIDREQALKSLADELGTSVDEVRIGIVLGEGRGLFARSADGLFLQAI